MKRSTSKSQNNKLKVALAFDDSLDRSDGVQQQLKLLGKWLEGNGCQVVYLAGETQSKSINGMPVYSLSRNFSISANQNRLTLPGPVNRSKVEAVFNKEGFDIVHITLPFSPFLGRQIVRTALARQIPLVGTFHTFPASRLQSWGSYLYGRWLKRYLKRFAALTSVSEATQQYAQRTFSVESEVIPNFIDLNKFKAGKRLERLANGKRTVLYLGRLVERKGPHHLVEAIKILEDLGKFDSSQLLLCGTGEHARELRKQIVNRRLSNKVLMPGFIDEDDKPDYLATADLAVFPATGGEAFGIVLLEAMASGTLVLGGNNPGYKTILKNKPQLLVDATDHEALAANIDRLLSDGKLKAKLLGWQNKQIKQYDVKNVGPLLLDLYRTSVQA